MLSRVTKGWMIWTSQKPVWLSMEVGDRSTSISHVPVKVPLFWNDSCWKSLYFHSFSLYPFCSIVHFCPSIKSEGQFILSTCLGNSMDVHLHGVHELNVRDRPCCNIKVLRSYLNAQSENLCFRLVFFFTSVRVEVSQCAWDTADHSLATLMPSRVAGRPEAAYFIPRSPPPRSVNHIRRPASLRSRPRLSSSYFSVFTAPPRVPNDGGALIYLRPPPLCSGLVHCSPVQVFRRLVKTGWLASTKTDRGRRPPGR